MLGVWVVELLALVIRRITKKDALLHVGSQSTTLILLHMHIGKTTPYAQIGHIWLALESHLKRSGVGHGGCGDAVEDVDQCSKSFFSELSRQTSFMKHGSDLFSKSPV